MSASQGGVWLSAEETLKCSKQSRKKRSPKTVKVIGKPMVTVTSPQTKKDSSKEVEFQKDLAERKRKRKEKSDSIAQPKYDAVKAKEAKQAFIASLKKPKVSVSKRIIHSTPKRSKSDEKSKCCLTALNIEHYCLTHCNLPEIPIQLNFENNVLSTSVIDAGSEILNDCNISNTANNGSVENVSPCNNNSVLITNEINAKDKQWPMLDLSDSAISESTFEQHKEKMLQNSESVSKPSDENPCDEFERYYNQYMLNKGSEIVLDVTDDSWLDW